MFEINICFKNKQFENNAFNIELIKLFNNNKNKLKFTILFIINQLIIKITTSH